MWQSPNNQYSGVSIGEPKPRVGRTMLNGRMVNFQTTPGGFVEFDDDAQGSVAQPPDEAEMLTKRFRTTAAQNVVNQIRGDVPVGLASRALLQDPQFARLWQSDEGKARQVYSSIYHGLTPEDDAVADTHGFKTLAALRAAQAAPKQSKELLSGIESSYGFNPGEAMTDFDAASGHGYEASTGLVHIPGGYIRNPDTGEYEQKPERTLPLGASTVQRIRSAQSAMEGYQSYDDWRENDPKVKAEREHAVRSRLQMELQTLRAKRTREQEDERRRTHAERMADPNYASQFQAELDAVRQQHEAAIYRRPVNGSAFSGFSYSPGQ